MVSGRNDISQRNELFVWKYIDGLVDSDEVKVGKRNAYKLCLAARHGEQVTEANLAWILLSVEDVLKQRRLEGFACSVATSKASVALTARDGETCTVGPL